MKRTILAVVAAAACSVEAAVMYRGRLMDAEHPDAKVQCFGKSKKMTFRFYDDSGVRQGEPLVRNVPLETNGMFTVLLDTPELSNALREGKATQVGLTVGDAANEIRPLRKLLPTARAVQADAATGLSRGAKVGKMTATCVEAEELAVGGNLTVGGAIKPVGEGFVSTQTVYKVRLGKKSKLRAKDGKIVVLDEPELLTPNLAQGCPSVKAGEVIKDPNGRAVVAPADGIATISCVESLKQAEVNGSAPMDTQGRGKYYASAYSPCCSVVRFCKKGEEIKVPAGWSWQPWGGEDRGMRFTVRFHRFVVK